MKFIGDRDINTPVKVIKRTAKFVTIQLRNEEPKRVKINLHDNCEFIYPEGYYSMAPTAYAKRPFVSPGTKENKVEVINIEISRVEGPTELCGVSHNFKSFKFANLWIGSQLGTVSTDIPEKHDYEIIWSSGKVTKGTFLAFNPECSQYRTGINKLEYQIETKLKSLASSVYHWEIEYKEEAKLMLENYALK